MGRVRDLAERLWTGESRTDDYHPWTALGQIEEIADRTIFYSSFANVTAFETDGGLVLIDTGAFFNQRQTFAGIRAWSKARLDTAVYTHGHVDHVFGVPPFALEAKENRWPGPRVIGHEAVPARFQRYILTAGYNSIINTRQFGFDSLRSAGGDVGRSGAIQWPTEYTYPDTTYSHSLVVTVGGERFELYHDRGETDDHTWVWVPGRKVLCPGDLFIWAVPNAGNPQKVQRYPLEWARALRKMAALEVEVLSPGHGVIIVGRDRVRQALTDTADFLESLHDQTVALMNQGATLDTILHTVRPPEALPPAGLRRAGVHRQERLAPVRRLVRWHAIAAKAGASGAAGSGDRPSGRRRAGACRARSATDGGRGPGDGQPPRRLGGGSRSRRR
jgi:glyoxylase-like metal-dependent hydrolase (beta-lactamase superfamily II)